MSVPTPAGAGRLLTLTVTAGLVLAPLVGVGAAEAQTSARPKPVRPSATTPRIIAASMVDTDRDDKADALRLTYSVPVRHPSDRDGRYPISVGGYTIRSIAKAAGSRTVVVTLVEHSTPDIGARPQVRYTPTKKGAVTGAGRRQAAAQTFTATRPLDLDGDGYAARDCAPTDKAVHPGAVDLPDLGGVDANCDGIDGLRTGPVFVSPTGSDSARGSITAPVRSLARAVALAGAGGQVYLAAGSVAGTVPADSTVHLFGGYTSGWRKRTGTTLLTTTGPMSLTGSSQLQQLSIASTPRADHADNTVLAVHDATLVLEKVALSSAAGQAGDATHPAASSIAVKALRSTVRAFRGSVTAGPGGAGTAGAAGTPGATGGAGQGGADSPCTPLGPAPLGGAPGTTPDVTRAGGIGGAGGLLLLPGSPGLPSADGTTGGGGGATNLLPGVGGGAAGSPGTAGPAGAAGAPGTATAGHFTADGYAPGTATAGATGAPGSGGGGGGGGGSQLPNLPLLAGLLGNGGGGGGAGGAGGTGGTPGTGGGASVAVWATDSQVTLDHVAVATRSGGAGGRGGAGGVGGAGGSGGPGASACSGAAGPGGRGGNGGAGGVGGRGGNGPGGPSVGIVTTRADSVSTPGVDWLLGLAGASPDTPSLDGLAAPLGVLGCGGAIGLPGAPPAC